MDSVDPRRLAPLVAALALVPVALFIVDRGAWFVALSLVSVLIIAASVYLLFGPAAGPSHGGGRPAGDPEDADG